MDNIADVQWSMESQIIIFRTFVFSAAGDVNGDNF